MSLQTIVIAVTVHEDDTFIADGLAAHLVALEDAPLVFDCYIRDATEKETLAFQEVFSDD